MTQQPLSTLTSPTSQSCSGMGSNLKMLQGSSIASCSLPEQSPSLTGKVFLQFEQFTETRVRKDTTLSIKIDQNFDCRMIDAPGIRNLNKKPTLEEMLPQEGSMLAAAGYDSHKSEHLKLIVEYREKIEEMSGEIIRLEGMTASGENEIARLTEELESSRQNCSDLQMKNEHLKLIIRKRDETISTQKELLESYSKRFSDIEKEAGSIKQYEERLKERDAKLRESARKVDKLATINKTLSKELKDANFKIMQLEKEMQTVVCTQLQQHRSKLKESALNKENLQDNNYRKSLEGGKKQPDRAFTSTISSTLRTSSNHPIEKRVKSISNIHKAKY